MGYDGFLSRAGIELLNEERTRAYIDHQMPQFPLARNFDVSQTLHVALGEEPYESPLIDDAEWVNPSDPTTHGFYGLYPLGITGMGSSTRTAATTESLTDGGTVGSSRDGTREIRVHGLLVGENDLAVESGLSWLRAALRTSNCGMHGVGCGASDLRFFLADPQVCDPLFEQTPSGTPELISVGTVTPDNSPNFVDINRVVQSPASVTWKFELVDGVVITWGKIARDSSKVLYESSPTILQRTNFIPNPSFTEDAAEWDAITGTLARSATGGVDGGGYGHAAQVSPPEVFYNWVPDPSFVNDDPRNSGWRAINNGVLSVEPDPGAAGNRVLLATRAAGETVVGVEVSLLGPVVDHGLEALFSTLCRPQHNGELVTFEIFDNLGVLQSTYSFLYSVEPAFDGIDGLTLSGLAENYIVRITAPTAELRITQPIVQSDQGAPPTTFFSGSTAASAGTVYRYIGASLTSASLKLVGTPGPVEVGIDTPDTRYGDTVASFSIRSEMVAIITVDLISTEGGGEILATRQISTGLEWTRYSLMTPYGRGVGLRFHGDGFFDVDQVLVEASATLWDYFDGSSPAVPEYLTSWLGRANGSPSRMAWTGTTLLESSDSNWRPFISSQQGSLPNVMAQLESFAPITVEQQIEKYERNYHDVYVVEGPTVIKRYPNELLEIGAAIEVDFVLVAETPFAYSNGRSVDTTDPPVGLFSDPVDVETNYFTNPIVGTGLAGFTGSADTGSPVLAWGTGTAGSGPVGTTTFAQLTASTAFGWLELRFGSSATVQPLTPGEIYVFSGYLWATFAGTADLTVRWYSPLNALLRTDSIPAGIPVTTAWQRCDTGGLIAPPNAAYATLALQVQPDAAQTSGTIRLGATQVSNRIAVTDFFYGGTADTSEFVYDWTGAANASTSTKTAVPVPENVLIDPDCGPLPAAPRPPVVPELCVDNPENWRRYWVSIPAEDVALWAGTVPTIALNTRTLEERQVRVRFHPNPFDYPIQAVDPLSYCGEFILSYLPANTLLTMNGMNESAFAQVAGGEAIPADHLLYGTGGTPMEWPELSCGIPYVMTIDVPVAEDLDNLDISLVVNRRE